MANATQSVELEKPIATGADRGQQVRARMASGQVAADQLAYQTGELRLAGLSFGVIAQQLHCSKSSAIAAWKRFRKSLVLGDVASEREVLVGRLTRQYKQLGPKMAAADTKAHAVGVQILELMSAVMGMEPPRSMAVAVMADRPPITVLEFGLRPPHDESNPWDSPALLEEGAPGDATDAPVTPRLKEASSDAS
jgi:hypothetical protein